MHPLAIQPGGGWLPPQSLCGHPGVLGWTRGSGLEGLGQGWGPCDGGSGLGALFQGLCSWFSVPGSLFQGLYAQVSVRGRWQEPLSLWPSWAAHGCCQCQELWAPGALLPANYTVGLLFGRVPGL